MRVKVCGNTDISTALVAVEAGADALGFILAPGTPRSLEPDRAAAIVRELPRSVDLVGVFVDRPAAEIVEVAGEIGLTAVQLHGSETWDEFQDMDLPLIKAIRLGGPADGARVAWPPGSILLADTYHPGLPGGTGEEFPWSWAADLSLHYRLIVSGGLSPFNVAAAVRQLRPWGVDASSRLESSPGVKDPELVRGFVTAARRAGSEDAPAPSAARNGHG
jgi:phosphoribosylanthranilate isomerase